MARYVVRGAVAKKTLGVAAAPISATSGQLLVRVGRRRVAARWGGVAAWRTARKEGKPTGRGVIAWRVRRRRGIATGRGVDAWGTTRRGRVATRREVATSRRGVPRRRAAKVRWGWTSKAPTPIVRRRGGRQTITDDTLAIRASVAGTASPVCGRGLPIATTRRAIRRRTTRRGGAAVPAGRGGVSTIKLLLWGRPTVERWGAPTTPLVGAAPESVVGHRRRKWSFSPGGGGGAKAAGSDVGGVGGQTETDCS